MLLCWADFDTIKPICFWYLSIFPNYISVLWKSSCPREISFLPPPPSPPLHHHYPTTTACHLFTLGGLGMGMETGHKLKQFSKTQTRLLEETTSFLHSILGRPQSLPQSVDSTLEQSSRQEQTSAFQWRRVCAILTCPKCTV